MSDNEGGDLQLLGESVACVRTALNEILLCHEQALSALENLETELQNHPDLNRRATPAAESPAAESRAFRQVTPTAHREAACGSRKRPSAARAKEPATKRAKATSTDAVAKKGLLTAVQKGNLASVKSFLSVVDPNFFDDDGNTPLHLAAKNRRDLILEVLLKNGADVRTTNHSQQTALHAAVLADTKGACCELLLRAIEETGAETVNIQDNTQRTALHYAAIKGNVRAVELLLEYGADTSIKNVKGTTALDVASTPQVLRLLRNA